MGPLTHTIPIPLPYPFPLLGVPGITLDHVNHMSLQGARPSRSAGGSNSHTAAQGGLGGLALVEGDGF